MITGILRKLGEIQGIKLKQMAFPEKEGLCFISFDVESLQDIPKWEYFIKSLRSADPKIKVKRRAGFITVIFPFSKDEREAALSTFEEELEKKKYLIAEPEAEHLTIIAKVTNLCNLNCEYCYDRPFREKLGHNGVIEMHKLDHLIDMACRYSKKVAIIFHGGEPTLAGTDFYRKFLGEILPKYPYAEISINMQTNGTLLDDEWFEMLDDYNKSHEGTFQVGTSFNALAESLRFGNESDSISEKVLSNMKKAKCFGYNLGIGAIDVVTKPAHPHMIEMYEFYKKNGLAASFNLVNESGAAVGKDMIFRTRKEQERYLKDTEKYFVYWLNDSDENVYADRYASEFTELLLKGGTVCEFGNDCVGNWIGINSNGDLYPCDRALSNKYRMGNVMQFKSVDEIFNSEGFKTIRTERDRKFSDYCSDCSYFAYCHLNCPMKDIDLYNSADRPNRIECEMLRLSVQAAYRALFSTDIERCNLIIRTFFIKNCCILPKEIPRLLKELGLEEKYRDYDFSLDNAKLFNKEFELFRLFNCIPGEDSLLPHDYEVSVEDRDVYLTDNRFERIKAALKDRAKEIERIISEGEKK